MLFSIHSCACRPVIVHDICNRVGKQSVHDILHQSLVTITAIPCVAFNRLTFNRSSLPQVKALCILPDFRSRLVSHSADVAFVVLCVSVFPELNDVLTRSSTPLLCLAFAFSEDRQSSNARLPSAWCPSGVRSQHNSILPVVSSRYTDF